MKETKAENKLFNVFLLGDIKSEKNKIIQQYILSNNKENRELEQENNINETELTQSFEIHGETIKMKILEVPQLEQIFPSEQESSSQTHGILLFYSVADRDSFDKLKEIISKIIDMNKYEMPIVLVGNNSDESQRKVPYEEAKNFSEKYGLKYHETSKENNFVKMKDIFKDLGEQVLYQDILDKNKNNEKDKNIDTNKNKENKDNKDKLSKIKSKTDIREKKTQLQKKREDEVREKRIKREKEMQLWYKKREREGIELKKKKAIEDKMKLIEKIKEDKIIQKQREKEVKEEFFNEKKEKYEKSKKEKEEGEKKNLLEKEKNKLLFEKKRKSEKENLKKLLLENEQNDKESIKQKKSKISSPQSSKSRQRKNFDTSNEQSFLNNTVTDFYKRDKDSINESQTRILKKNPTIGNFLKSEKNLNKNIKNEKNKKLIKSKSSRKVTKSQNKSDVEKTEQKIKEIKINMEEIEQKEKEEKLIQEQIKLKNELKENYLNYNGNIYRCLYCHKIPIININEFNHQIEIYCNCKNDKDKVINSNYNYFFSYNYFEEKSLNHPIDNNIACFHCNKKINELNDDNINMNLCYLCNEIICSKDEQTHKKEKHLNYKELKEQYKNLSIRIDSKKNEEKTLKANKNKINNDSKNRLTTPSKPYNTVKKSSNTPKKDKNLKEEKKSISNKKNLTSSTIKTSNKKSNEKNKITEKDNNINNNEEEEKKKTQEEKVPIYLYDSCCFEHGKIYSNYCHDCFKNICDICEEKEHKNHHIVKFSDIMVDEEKLENIKQSLEKDINDLNRINDYFNKLMEKIKEEYSYFFELKKKEIEIKQKIIKDYETIKYNYNSIQNSNNINYKNVISDKNYLISNLEKINNNNDIISELKLIFNFLNKSVQTTNSLNYYNNSNNILIENGKREISDIIQFDKTYIAISFYDGNLSIYDNNYFNLILSCKIFDNNKGISRIIWLSNGNLACCGYEKIKVVNIDLDNKNYQIISEMVIKNASFNLVKELKNHYLITYDTNDKLKIWYKYIQIFSINTINIYSLLILKNNLFITTSNTKLNLYNINIDNNNYITLNCFSLDNISVKKLKNPIISLNDNYVIVLVNFKEQRDCESSGDVFEESKNNQENNDDAVCLIEIGKKFKLEIIQDIKNNNENGQYISIINYINDSFLLLNDLGIIELWNLDTINKKLIILNKFKAVDNIYNKETISMIFIENNKNIILQDYKNIICLSHE